jgi:hypothetical protein
MTAIVQKRGPVNGGLKSKFLGLGDESKGVKRVRNGDDDEDDKFGERAGKKLGECVLRFVSSEDDADICK